MQAFRNLKANKNSHPKIVMIDVRCDSTSGGIIYSPTYVHSNKTTKVKLAKNNITKMEIYYE